MRKLFVLMSILTFFSCTNSKEWVKSKDSIFYVDKFRDGDIIVKNKLLSSPLSWFGHVGIVLKNGEIGDFPKLGSSFTKTKISEWLYEDRKIIILRYKKFREDFREKFFSNLKDIENKKYKLFSKKSDPNTFYCSKLIWYLFYKTAGDMGYYLDIGSGSFFVTPYDILKSEEFEKIEFELDKACN